MRRFWAVLLTLVLTSSSFGQLLTLAPGEHVCLVGNGLAERMQHGGHFEALLHARFPTHQTVIRNLGYSGDEIDGFRNPASRLRSMDFGSHDQWLAGVAPCPQPTKLSPRDAGKVRENRFEFTNTRADVVLAFYGYNESFAGEAGVAKFRENVDAFIQHTLSQKYNGKCAPKLVLVSPIAMEFLADPNLPSRAEVDATNARIKLYTETMRAVAAERQIPFVDLFAASSELYASETARGPLTFNGIHITKRGDELLSLALARALFGDAPRPAGDGFNLLLSAVQDKNFYWYNRHRVTDGYSTYGDRAFLKFAEGPGGYGDGLSNYSVAQRELEVLDLLTANRDAVIWGAAQGKKVAPDDSNLPEFLTVISNKPGSLENGKHLYLSGDEAIQQMTVHKDMEVKLFADEAMFPELVNPVQMAFDAKGRLWVAAWRTYPHWKPTEKMDDKLLILEDTNNDGRADRCVTFADDIHNPTGFEFWNGGVLVAQGPDLLFLKDTNGDDRYDMKERILHGLDTADTHHTANSFVLDPGGALYFQEGTFHHSQVETPWGSPRRVANGAVFRYDPRQRRPEIYVTFGFANPHGHAFNRWGQDIIVDGTGANPFHGPLFSSHLDFPNKHNRPPQVYQQRTRPCPAIEFLSSSHFPEEYRGSLLVPNVIGFQGILMYKMHDQDSSLGATEVEPIVASTDANFRPADVEVAPDGSIYFTDWHNPIIGHMQHNLRDPNRDQIHGRVYRVTYKGRPVVTPVAISGEPIEKLLEVLKHPDDRIRYRARIELSGRESSEVIAATRKWISGLDAADPAHDHHLLEGLWVHQHHNRPDAELLQRVLKSKDSHARAAAVRVLVAWREVLANRGDSSSESALAATREVSQRAALAMLLHAAADENPQVRLMAVWGASFIPLPESTEVVLVAAEYPTDAYLEFLTKEVQRTLQPILDQALAQNQPVAFSTEAGSRFLLRSMPTDQLLAQKRTRAVCLEMLYRPGLQDAHRRVAIETLAELDKKPEIQVIMDVVQNLDARQQNADTTVIFDLIRQLTSRDAEELATARDALQKLALTAKQPIFRQIGYVSLLSVDGNIDPVWKLATSQADRLVDFLNAMPIISDATVRASLYSRIEPLLDGLPQELSAPKDRGTVGRFVRIELPKKGTLTLAEVEVFSGGSNIARRGRASQKNTSHGGDASKAIDGGTGGLYSMNSQTHSEEDTGKPWWEVDLGEDLPIERIVIWNRTDGDLGNRLANFSVKVLDSGRAEVWKQENNAAPKRNVAFAMEGGGKEELVRRAAMNALTFVRGQELNTFQRLSKFVREDVDRVAAIRAMQRLPIATWPKDQAPELVHVLLEGLKKTAASERTSAAALDQFEFADALVSLLPADQVRSTRAQLRELGVRVIKIGTIFEKMAFDKELVVVQAGKPVEFLLENSDLMPHNFVITKPGSLEQVGMLSEAQAQQPGFAERHYVPESPSVLAKSTLLQPRETQRVSFQAPTEAGVYPYVCTYPGHWRRMYGALYVVDDIDGYLADPEGYLAKTKLEARDPLLKDNRPRTEWKLEDLAEVVTHLEHEGGRNYATGRQLFTAANCVACHRIEQEKIGNVFGPELSKLDPKLQPLDILKSILDPSEKIEEKFQSNTIETGEGRVLTGLVVKETPEAIELVENPLVSVKPQVIPRGDIVERVRSKVSIMPKGLLDKLTREEILDLVAFVASRGNKDHAFFKATHHHDH